MRFTLIDRVTALEPGQRITALKNLSLAEEYLADHFPGFPVMPGVLMLEAMTQAGAWLVRATEDFAHSVVVLHEARNVKYANFVKPSQTLEVHAEWQSDDGQRCKLKTYGLVEGRSSVSARLVLQRYNLADRDPGQAATDAWLVKQLRQQWAVLWPAVQAGT
jgi:3-hydroxyacyl-[acyl-carrier-protein] dehydratase